MTRPYVSKARTLPPLPRAGLCERYVRKWLGAVTTGGIVEYDQPTGFWQSDIQPHSDRGRPEVSLIVWWIPLGPVAYAFGGLSASSGYLLAVASLFSSARRLAQSATGHEECT